MALDVTISGADADSYVTLAEYSAYATSLGWLLRDTEAENEQDLRRAAMANDRNNLFLGYPVSASQARAFPRYITAIVDGHVVDSAAIPQDVKDAQCEMAYAIKSGADPFAAVTPSLKRTKAGPVEVEYSGGQGAERIAVASGLLRSYLISGPGQIKMGRA